MHFTPKVNVLNGDAQLCSQGAWMGSYEGLCSRVVLFTDEGTHCPAVGSLLLLGVPVVILGVVIRVEGVAKFVGHGADGFGVVHAESV